MRQDLLTRQPPSSRPPPHSIPIQKEQKKEENESGEEQKKKKEISKNESGTEKKFRLRDYTGFSKTKRKEFEEAEARFEEMQKTNLVQMNYGDSSDGSSPKIDDIDVTPPGSEIMRTNKNKKKRKKTVKQKEEEAEKWKELWQKEHTGDSDQATSDGGASSKESKCYINCIIGK